MSVKRGLDLSDDPTTIVLRLVLSVEQHAERSHRIPTRLRGEGH
jgi:hypothetical protein